MKNILLGFVALLFISGCKKSETTPAPAPTITSFSPASGTAGTTVTISGANLVSVKSVQFNGSEAFFKFQGAGLTAVVPANSTTGHLSVITAGGTASSSDGFTVLPDAGPVPVSEITAVLPSNNPVSWPVLIQGVNIDSIKGIKFGSVVAVIDTNFSGVVTTRVPAGVAPGVLQLTMINKNGASISVPFTILANIPPVQTPPSPVVFKSKTKVIPHFQNTWINEANNDQNLFLESNLQGDEFMNDNFYSLTVTSLDTLETKTINLQIVRATDNQGNPTAFENYTGTFVESDAPNKDRIIFWSEEGRQIMVYVTF